MKQTTIERSLVNWIDIKVYQMGPVGYPFVKERSVIGFHELKADVLFAVDPRMQVK